MVEAAFNVT